MSGGAAAVGSRMRGVHVRVESLVKRYGRVAALDGVSLEFAAGGLTAILGPSGCGKTTLLRSLAGFVTVDGGRIRFGGDDVTGLSPQARGTAMVFQNYALWPHMTVFENVAYGLRLRKLRGGRDPATGGASPESGRDRPAGASWTGSRVSSRAGSSSGWRSRGRSWWSRACSSWMSLLSNLDAKVRQRLRVEVRRLQRAVGITAIYVTHDQEEALAIADTVVLMNAGRIVQAGSPQEIYFRPGSAFAAEFLGVSNQLRATAEADGLAVEGQRLPYGGAVRGAGTVIFKASDAVLLADGTPPGPGDAVLRGVLEEHLFLGSVYRHYVRVGGELVMVDAAEPAPVGPVTVRIPAAKLQVYPAG